MNLKSDLLRGLLSALAGISYGGANCLGVYAYGFERPSAIQQRAIMPIIKG
jgi:hypothetical protein